MINPVTLEQEPGQDLTFRASDDILQYIQDIRHYRGYSLDKAIDYALSDYWYNNFGRCLNPDEETISPERYYQRRWIMQELYLDVDEEWSNVVWQYKDCTVEALLEHGFYQDLAEAIVYEISLAGQEAVKENDQLQLAE